jgi:transposase InsO family protein
VSWLLATAAITPPACAASGGTYGSRRFAHCCGLAKNRPNQAWVADITYIRTRSGWLYLSMVLDLFAGKVVGWAIASDM